MVCKKCEKVSCYLWSDSEADRTQKTSTLAAPDPFQPSSSTRKIGENKLLSARARASPYTKPNQMTKGGKMGINPYGNKCLDCKVSQKSPFFRYLTSLLHITPSSSHSRLTRQQAVQQNQATRCQKCAYKKGCCSICGVMVLDTSRESTKIAHIEFC
jgi:hypothetical protein